MSAMNDNPSPWIVETDQATFEKDVFERSKEVPVVLDFWAAWCGPCRLLGPLLEEFANEYAGKFVLVKAETDRVPQAAVEFNVQSIPVVYAVCDGEVVDFFQGALPGEQIKPWLDRVLLHGVALEAKRLESSDPAAAEAKYRELMEQSPNDASHSIGLARVLLAQDRENEAGELIEQLEKRGFLEPEAEQVKATLELRSKRGVDVSAVRAAAEENPQDLTKQLQLAEALAANEQYQEALDVALLIVEADKKGVGDEARQVMVDIFRVATDEDMVRQYRRKLSTLLY